MISLCHVSTYGIIFNITFLCQEKLFTSRFHIMRYFLRRDFLPSHFYLTQEFLHHVFMQQNLFYITLLRMERFVSRFHVSANFLHDIFTSKKIITSCFHVTGDFVTSRFFNVTFLLNKRFFMSCCYVTRDCKYLIFKKQEVFTITFLRKDIFFSFQDIYYLCTPEKNLPINKP